MGEVYILPRALAWWPLCLLLLPLALIRGKRAAPPAGVSHRPKIIKLQADLAGWTMLSYVTWILLMFLPNNALIHQGSYMIPLGLFVLLASFLPLGGGWMLVPVALLQTFTFGSTYWVANDSISGGIDPIAISAATAASLVYIVMIAAGIRNYRQHALLV